jgi:hypothetical protein
MSVCNSRWRKSSRSDSGGSCVELAHTLGAVRDSKNPGGPVLAVPVSALLATVKDGKLHR